MTVGVKVCGVRSLGDARLAAELGAAAVGFVFWPDSPRFIDPFRARRIVVELPPFLATVGVFVDQPLEYVGGVATLLGLNAVQLHGNEDIEPFLRLPQRIIKAVAVREGKDVAGAVSALPQRVTPLLDAHDPVRRGGTGTTIDRSAAAAAARLRPVILSGGLNPQNVASTIEAVRPWAVDVSSGVESAPGVKDPEKLRAFFAAIRRVGRPMSNVEL